MNTNDSPRCPTCNAPQVLEREFSKAIMHRRFPRGRWTCPHEEREWHVQAERLGREMVATASPSLKRMLERDLEVLLGGVLIFEASVALEEVSA